MLYLKHIGGLPWMVATVMLVTKEEKEWRVSSLINSGGLESLGLSTRPSRIVSDVSFTEGGKKTPVVPLMVTAPLQLVHLNFTSFEMATNLNESPKVEHTLVIVDHFTRYTRAYVTKDQKASTAVKILYEGFISIFGAPERILMDQGKAFTSEVVEQLCSQFGISQLTTTAYHPQGNGQVE